MQRFWANPQKYQTLVGWGTRAGVHSYHLYIIESLDTQCCGQLCLFAWVTFNSGIVPQLTCKFLYNLCLHWICMIPEVPAKMVAGVWFHSWSFSSAFPHSRGHSQVAPHWWNNVGICSSDLRGQSSPHREREEPSHGREMTWKDSGWVAYRSDSKSHPCRRRAS